MIPIAKPFIGVEEETAALEVLRSGWLAQGSRVAAFERAFAEIVGATHAVAVSSCTTALHLVLVALGIGPGDEVVCPSLSFIATANSVIHAGARPVFADVDARTFNLAAAAVERALGPRTRAILVAHQVGLPADLEELTSVARARRLALIEDAACALGATYRGVRIGQPHGVAACFSFHPRKILTTGEGGMITTADCDLADRLRRLRQHGLAATFDRNLRYTEIGFNYRMTDLQAAVGLVQLSRLEGMLARRREHVAQYRTALAAEPRLLVPEEPSDRQHGFQSFVIRLRDGGRERRDQVIDALGHAGVSARPGIMAAHREPAHATQGDAALPVTEQVADSSIALPLYHELSDADRARVIDALLEAVRLI
jgi:dTDP-4-amino-4,6-dideoxygalactose transaminase